MSERENDYAPLSLACVRGLCDKLYEKRKTAGTEIEKMVKEFSESGNSAAVRRVTRVLGEELAASSNPSVKVGALLGLSSVAVGLGKEGCREHLGALLPPLLACTGESSRVRYHAVEALFNVAKVCRGGLLPHFPALLEALVRLAGDPEPQLAQAAELLDRLLKEVVTESGQWAGAEGAALGAWGGAVRAALGARGRAARALGVGWLGALAAAHAPLPALAPDLLDPLLRVLADPDPDLRRMCAVQLAALLRGVQAAPHEARLPALWPLLAAHAAAPDARPKLTALQWAAALVRCGGGGGAEGDDAGGGEGAGGGSGALAAVPALLAAALPPLASQDDDRREIREAAASLNAQLMALVEESMETPQLLESTLDVAGVVAALLPALGGGGAGAGPRRAALAWLELLYRALPQKMRGQSARVHAGVVRAAGGEAAAARAALRLLLDIARAHRQPDQELEASEYYQLFLDGVLGMLAEEPALLEDRGAFVIREVVALGGARAYVCLAERAGAGAGAEGGALAALLSELLLCAPELRATRDMLRAQRDEEARSLLRVLWRVWAGSPVSLAALCLLTARYRLAAALLHCVGELEVTVELLTEVDKLVQLLESPIFTFLRLELVGGRSGGAARGGAGGGAGGGGGTASLRAALSALLMLLPQGDAFRTLRRRLKAAPAADAGAPLPPLCAEDAALLDAFLRHHDLADPAPAPDTADHTSVD